MTSKEFVQQFFPTAQIHAHGREIWIFSITAEEHSESNYKRPRDVLSKTFVYEGPWEDVREESVWEETCLPVWDDAAERIRSASTPPVKVEN